MDDSLEFDISGVDFAVTGQAAAAQRVRVILSRERLNFQR
jgi:hypothetical protein